MTIEETQEVEVSEEVIAETGAEQSDPVVVGSKDDIYALIAGVIKEKTGKRVGKAGGREIFDMVVQESFGLAVRQKALRFNGGFGSLHVKDYQAGSRRLPNGDTVTFGERSKLRYDEGVCVKQLVLNGGDMADALSVRGTRAKATPETATEVPPETATEAAPAEEGGDLDLD